MTIRFGVDDPAGYYPDQVEQPLAFLHHLIPPNRMRFSLLRGNSAVLQEDPAGTGHRGNQPPDPADLLRPEAARRIRRHPDPATAQIPRRTNNLDAAENLRNASPRVRADAHSAGPLLAVCHGKTLWKYLLATVKSRHKLPKRAIPADPRPAHLDWRSRLSGVLRGSPLAGPGVPRVTRNSPESSRAGSASIVSSGRVRPRRRGRCRAYRAMPAWQFR